MEDHDEVTFDKFSLSFLSSLIPKTFSGKWEELNNFIINCNSAFKLAKEEHHVPLLYMIISKIEDPANSQLTNFIFHNWDQLKEELCLLYQDRKITFNQLKI